MWRERGFLREALLAGILSNLAAIVLPLFVMTAYDKVIPNAAFSSLWALAVGVLIAAVLDVLARLARSKMLESLGTRVDLRLGARLLRRMLDLSYVDRPKQLGEVSAGFRELESLRALLSNATLTLLVDLPFAALFVFVIWLIAPPLALPALIALPVLILLALLSGWRAAAHQPEALAQGQQQSAALVEGFAQFESVKALALEDRIQARWERAAANRAVAQDKSRDWNAVPTYVASAVSMLASAGVVVLGAFLVAEQEATLGALIAAMILTGRAVAPASGLAGLINGYVRARQALSSVADLLSGADTPRSHAAQVLGHWQLEGVQVSYPESPKPALEGIQLEIKPGEKVGILGQGGSGKTTLARVLAGIVAPSQGMAKLDQVDINLWEPEARAAGVGYLPQQPGFFAGSVRDNVLWGRREVDESELGRACELTGLDAFLAAWPGGWEQPVGEGGMLLSGSQRTVVALTRMVLSDPAFVVLDEPTAHLDARSEAGLRERFSDWLAPRGVVVVTHRGSLLSWVDRLIVVEASRVIADGPKDEIMKLLRHQQGGRV